MPRSILIFLTLFPSIGMAHPGGATVSMGSNPIVSFGGSMGVPTTGEVSTELAAPADKDLVLTDMNISGSTNYSDCSENWPVTFTIDGTTVAVFTTGPNMLGSNRGDQRFQQTFVSGIRIPAGQTMTMSTLRSEWNGSCGWARIAEIRWTFSGYYAQP